MGIVSVCVCIFVYVCVFVYVYILCVCVCVSIYSVYLCVCVCACCRRQSEIVSMEKRTHVFYRPTTTTTTIIYTQHTTQRIGLPPHTSAADYYTTMAIYSCRIDILFKLNWYNVGNIRILYMVYVLLFYAETCNIIRVYSAIRTCENAKTYKQASIS